MGRTLRSNNVCMDGNKSSDDEDELSCYLEKAKKKQLKPILAKSRQKTRIGNAKNLSSCPDLLAFVSQPLAENSEDSLKVASEEVINLSDSSSTKESVLIQECSINKDDTSTTMDNINIDENASFIPPWLDKDIAGGGDMNEQSYSRDKTLRMVGLTNKLQSQCDSRIKNLGNIHETPAEVNNQEEYVCVNTDAQVYVPDVCSPPEQVSRQLDFEVPLSQKLEEKERFYLIKEKDWLSMCEKVKSKSNDQQASAMNSTNSSMTDRSPGKISTAIASSLPGTHSNIGENVYIHLGFTGNGDSNQSVCGVNTKASRNTPPVTKKIESDQSVSSVYYTACSHPSGFPEQLRVSHLPADASSYAYTKPAATTSIQIDAKCHSNSESYEIIYVSPSDVKLSSTGSSDICSSSKKIPYTNVSSTLSKSTTSVKQSCVRPSPQQINDKTNSVNPRTNSSTEINSSINGPGIAGRFVRRNSKLVFERYESSESLPDSILDDSFGEARPQNNIDSSVSSMGNFEDFEDCPLLAYPIYEEPKCRNSTGNACQPSIRVEHRKKVHFEKQTSGAVSDIKASKKPQKKSKAFVYKKAKSGEWFFLDNQNHMVPFKSIPEYIENLDESHARVDVKNVPSVKSKILKAASEETHEQVIETLDKSHSCLNLVSSVQTSTKQKPTEIQVADKHVLFNKLEQKVDSLSLKSKSDSKSSIDKSSDKLISKGTVAEHPWVSPVEMNSNKRAEMSKKETVKKVLIKTCTKHNGRKKTKGSKEIEELNFTVDEKKYEMSHDRKGDTGLVLTTKERVSSEAKSENEKMLKNQEVTSLSGQPIKCDESIQNPNQSKSEIHNHLEQLKPVFKPVSKQEMKKSITKTVKIVKKKQQNNQCESDSLYKEEVLDDGLGEYVTNIKSKKRQPFVKESLEIQTEIFSSDDNLCLVNMNSKQPEDFSKELDGEILRKQYSKRAGKPSVDYKKLHEGIKATKTDVRTTGKDNNAVSKQTSQKPGLLKKVASAQKRQVVTRKSTEQLKENSKLKHFVQGQTSEEKTVSKTIKSGSKHVVDISENIEEKQQHTTAKVLKTRIDKGTKRKKQLRFSDDVKSDGESTGMNAHGNVTENVCINECNIGSSEGTLPKKGKYTRKTQVQRKRALAGTGTTNKLPAIKSTCTHKRQLAIESSQNTDSSDLGYVRSQNDAHLPVKKRKLVQVGDTSDNSKTASEGLDLELSNSGKDWQENHIMTQGARPKKFKLAKSRTQKVKSDGKTVKRTTTKLKQNQANSTDEEKTIRTDNGLMEHNLQEQRISEGGMKSEIDTNSESSICFTRGSLDGNQEGTKQTKVKASPRTTARSKLKMCKSKTKEKLATRKSLKTIKHSVSPSRNSTQGNGKQVQGKRKCGRPKGKVSGALKTSKQRTLWERKKKNKTKGMSGKRVTKSVDNTWRELLSEDETTFDIRQIEREEVKHINVRQVIKRILKSSSKPAKNLGGTTNAWEQQGSLYSKAMKMSQSGKILHQKTSKANNYSVNVSDLSDSDASPGKVFKSTTSMSKQLTDGILKNLKERNNIGVHQLKELKGANSSHNENSPEVLNNHINSELDTNKNSTTKRYIELHNSPVKTLDAKLEGFKSISPIKSSPSSAGSSLYSSPNQLIINVDFAEVSPTSGAEDVGLNKNLMQSLPSPISKSVDRLTALLNKATATKNLKF